MNAREFFDLVVEMRDAQKMYFQTRDKNVLVISKALERDVDAEIDRVMKIIKEDGNER